MAHRTYDAAVGRFIAKFNADIQPYDCRRLGASVYAALNVEMPTLQVLGGWTNEDTIRKFYITLGFRVPAHLLRLYDWASWPLVVTTEPPPTPPPHPSPQPQEHRSPLNTLHLATPTDPDTTSRPNRRRSAPAEPPDHRPHKTRRLLPNWQHFFTAGIEEFST